MTTDRGGESGPGGSEGARENSPSPLKLRIVIADDHEVVRRGVRGLLEAKGWEVVGEASDGREAIEMVKLLSPDIVILDIAMPLLNGLEAARRIRKLVPTAEILVLSMYDSEQVVSSILAAGARGYVLKSDASHNLIAAVETLARHGPFFTSKVSRLLLDSYLSESDGEAAITRGKTLTAREREIVQLLAEGKSNKEVAAELGIAVKTVETHRNNLMHKLGMHSLSELIHYAIRNELVEP